MSTKLVSENQAIYTETLAVKNNRLCRFASEAVGTLQRSANHKLAQRVRADRRRSDDWGSFASRAIADCGWGEFLRQLEYKAKWHDRKIGAIDRWFPSTKRCHPCGYILNKLPLSIREWRCPNCNSLNLRDYNSSLNILAVGQTVFACGLSNGGDTQVTDLVNLG